MNLLWQTNGKEVMEMVGQEHYDIILMDVQCRKWMDWKQQE